MRLRAIHLASVLLLLASLGVAEGSSSRNGDYSLGAHYISVLLAQHEAAASIQAPRNEFASESLNLDLPTDELAHYRNPWTVAPPSAHTSSLHAVTGSSL